MGSKQYNKRLRSAQRAYIVEMKGGKCECCGRDVRELPVEFHSATKHREAGSVRVGKLFGCTLRRVWGEAKRSIMLCPTCHAISHADERGAPYATR